MKNFPPALDRRWRLRQRAIVLLQAGVSIGDALQISVIRVQWATAK
ncbi:hypothetical protein AMC99_00170 [Altererythrobacter epoxidivorans]|uniref:Uncharacterized protein n=1 Tax=Altererythrobacter epoxidivorans TaxID=361183 RepID=A0A0M3T9R4_9SPHN|nr:hypothetical protein AMC99_00170 [Altererythrobacter epoxidivorans]